MKLLRTGLIAAAALWGLPAFAQWQVPANTIPYGLGPGFVGFGSAANSGSGTSCLLNTSPPSFGSCLGTGAALTKADDTNVTLTLGGSPTTALVNAASITAGWTGRLAFSRFTQGSALSVLGVTGNATADMASIAAGADFNILRRSGTSVGFGAVDLSQAGAVGTSRLPFANLAQGSALSVLGVTGNATADNASIAAGSDFNILRRSGTAVAFGSINLASTNAVGTTRLPFANLTQGSALSVLGVTGNATADNASIAAGSDFNILRRSGTAVAFGSIDLSQSGAVGSSILPVANGGWGTAGGAWTNSTPTVTPVGGPGTFAATASVYTLQVGKTVFYHGQITITNVGTATSFNIPMPVTPLQTATMPVIQGTSTVGYQAYGTTGGATWNFIVPATGALVAPAVATWSFNTVYQAQ